MAIDPQRQAAFDEGRAAHIASVAQNLNQYIEETHTRVAAKPVQSHAQQQQQQDHHQPSPSKRFLTEADVEAAYGIPRKTLQKWRMLGRGPKFRKFGRGVKYDVRLLEAWIETLPSGGDVVPASALKIRPSKARW